MATTDRTWEVTVRVLAPKECEREHVESGIREAIIEGLDSFTVEFVGALEAW